MWWYWKVTKKLLEEYKSKFKENEPSIAFNDGWNEGYCLGKIDIFDKILYIIEGRKNHE